MLEFDIGFLCFCNSGVVRGNISSSSLRFAITWFRLHSCVSLPVFFVVVTATEFWESLPFHYGFPFCWYTKGRVVKLVCWVDLGIIIQSRSCVWTVLWSLLRRQSQEQIPLRVIANGISCQWLNLRCLGWDFYSLYRLLLFAPTAFLEIPLRFPLWLGFWFW